ncbi:partial CRISPR-associated endonuclease/helicase Cas3, partial [Gammaproteobacteria bacterium]
MLGEPTSFWGKLRRSPSGACEWHPLADHCADVGAVAEALLELPLWRQRLSRLAGQDLSATNRARLAAIATLHDLGKFNLGFQAKGRPDLGSTAGHVEEALAALFYSDLLGFVGELDAWGEGATGLVVSAICHHGRPHNIDAAFGKWQRAWWSARAGFDPLAGCRQLFESCRRWVPRAFDDAEDLPAGAAFAHAFAGLVTLSDWIASDMEFFPFSADAGFPDDRIRFARARAREALSAMSIEVPATRRADPENRSPFRRVTPPGLVARPAQAEICRLPADTDGSITVLESETGSGKTEAVLARFVHLFEKGLVDGLYFALPTRSAASQMHRRVLEAAQRAFVQPPPVVLAVPGYLRVDDAEGQRLPHFEVLWPDRDRFRYRAWAAENPKRYLVGCIVVGTIDQVLLSSLMVGHAHLRASALLRHLLVVDEVHASDAYM